MSDELFKNNTDFVVVFNVPSTKLDRATFTKEFSTHYPSLFVLPIVITYYISKLLFIIISNLYSLCYRKLWPEIRGR